MYYFKPTLDFLPENCPEQYRLEQWIYVTDIAIKDVIPNRYMVSTYGRKYDCESGVYTPNGNFKSKRYVYTRFKLTNGKNVLIGMHIVVLKSFCFIPNCEFLQVNHIDGVKYHNWLWNLEWCTPGENIKHAYDTGLHAIGEDNSTSKATNEQVHMICKLIAKGLRTKEIINQLQPYMPNINIKIVVDAIKSGKYWNHISKHYDLSNAYHNCRLLNNDQINHVCKLFETYGTNIQYRQVLDMIGYDYHNLSISEINRIKYEVSLIRNKKLRREICSQYNY